MLALWLEAQPSPPHLPSLCQLELPGVGWVFLTQACATRALKWARALGNPSRHLSPPPSAQTLRDEFDGSKKENEWKQRRSPQ